MAAGEINWADYDQFLGQFSDVEIASMVGCGTQVVRDRRMLLNIDPCQSFHGKIDYSIIRPKLGTMSDGNLAKWYHRKTGKRVSESSVRNYRKALNIKTFVDSNSTGKDPRKEEDMKHKNSSQGSPWEKTDSEILDSLKKAAPSRKVAVNYYNKNIMKKLFAGVPDVEKNDPKFSEAILAAIIKDMDISWSYQETQLKKCPFCYGRDIEIRPLKSLNSEKISEFATSCKSCNAMGPIGKSETEAMDLWGVEEVTS
jgi:hypothetical protein